MATTRVFASVSAVRGSHCNSALLNAFIPLARASVQLALKPSATKLSPTHFAQRRAFKVCSSWRSEFVQQNDQHSVFEASEENFENEKINNKYENPEPTSSVPWYLQIDSPQQPFRALSDRQRLPELPVNPPPLFQPMLEYLSIDLGLDDLSIFDLRKIDPPPALGTNLLMILGTARSEKHLHVSADRFCRWLRTTHKLSPYADGLLGRGELKLKTRRKARRARLLSSVGSSESSAVDDGLRTGWVCVNIGTIEDGGAAVEGFSRPEGFVGFGGQAAGAKIVIQMLTEEKREELDLEELWGGMLARQERKEARILKSQDEELSDEELQQEKNILPDHGMQKKEPDVLNQEVGRTSSILKTAKSDSLSYSPISPTNLSTFHSQQIRAFHSHPNSFTSETNSQEKSKYTGLEFPSVEPHVKLPQENPNSGSLNTFSYQPKDQTQDFDDTAKLVLLRTLLKHLENLPTDDAKTMLGSGIDDYTTTSFLKSFYQAFPIFPDAMHWECRLSLIGQALKLGHPNYRKSDLWRLYGEMQASVTEIPSNVYVMVFKMLLIKNRTVSKKKQKNGLSSTSVENALRVLEDMHFRGHNIKTEEIRTSLMVATILQSRNKYHLALPTVQRLNLDASQRLKEVLNQITPEPGSISVNGESHVRVLCAWADIKDWKGFWQYWHGIAASMQRRPKELYLLMFHRVAQTGQQAYSMTTLRECVPTMRREEPAVDLDADLAKAVMKCIEVAEPDTTNEVREGQNESGEWVKLWRRCELQLNPRSLAQHFHSFSHDDLT